MTRSLHDLGHLHFTIEQVAESGKHWPPTAASDHFSIALAAFDAAVASDPQRRWMLRTGIRVVKKHPPENETVRDRDKT